MNHRRKYEIFHHHAWAGLALLSVFLALRYFISFPNWISLPVVFCLVLYIIIALFFTYRYSSALSEDEPPVPQNEGMKKGRLKLEKKIVKAELKALKKRKK